MTRDRRIRFNGFKCSTVAHTTAGLWRHPNSQSHRYKELSFWIELAKTLERGKFDSLFVADALGVLDVYRGNPDQTLRRLRHGGGDAPSRLRHHSRLAV
jgi:long-chain alkane monooxygenase